MEIPRVMEKRELLRKRKKEQRRGSASGIRIRTDQHMQVKKLPEVRGRAKLLNTHRRAGISPRPTRQTEETPNSQDIK